MTQLIGFVDMNAYFASVEQQTNPALRGKPIAVAGRPHAANVLRGAPREARYKRSVVTTASYEARALGVKTAMSTREALTKLPSLTIVPPDYGKYQAYTKRITELAVEFSPTIELHSIDELALDLTHLLVPDNSAATVTQIRRFVTEFKARLSVSVGPLVTASIGFANSVPLAKLAADQFKPDGQFLIADTPMLAREAIIHGLSGATWVGLRQRLNLTSIPGIGPRLAPTLKLAGYHTLDDLAIADPGRLLIQFGVLGTWLSQIARGGPINRSTPSFRSATIEQSMSHTTTLPHDLPLKQTRAIFFILAERVADRMRRSELVARELFVGFGRTRQSSWYTHERYHYPITNGLALFRRGWHLVEQAWGNRTTLIRRPQIGIRRLSSAHSLPSSLLPNEIRLDRAHRTIGAIRDQWGSEIVQPATTLTTHVDRVPDGRRARYETLARMN